MTPQDLRRARDGAFDRDYVRPTSGYGAHSFWTFSYLSYALVRTHSQGSLISVCLCAETRVPSDVCVSLETVTVGIFLDTTLLMRAVGASFDTVNLRALCEQLTVGRALHHSIQ